MEYTKFSKRKEINIFLKSKSFILYGLKIKNNEKTIIDKPS